jgi:hypothetical protein
MVEHFAAQVCEVNGWKPKVFLPEAITGVAATAGGWGGGCAQVRLALPAGDWEVKAMAPVRSGSLAERTDAFERERILAEVGAESLV